MMAQPHAPKSSGKGLFARVSKFDRIVNFLGPYQIALNRILMVTIVVTLNFVA